MTMSNVHIQRFNATLRAANPEALMRAESTQRELLDTELEAALAPYAPVEEIILVKRLDAPALLASQHTGHASARDWSVRIAWALDRLLRGGTSANLLRFRHRLAAHLAFAQDAIDGLSQRDWAWHQLGLLPRATVTATASATARWHALKRLIAGDADTLVPLLRGLSESPHWPRFLAQLDNDALARLAQTLLRVFGATAPFAQTLAAIDPDAGAPPALSTENTSAEHAFTGTTVALLHATLGADPDPHRRLWGARLALLLGEPHHARHDASVIDRLLTPWLATARPDAPSPHAGEHGAITARLPDGPPLSHEREGPSELRHGIDRSHQKPRADPRDGTAANVANFEHPDRAPEPVAASQPISGHSEYAGLLLMLPLLEPSGALRLLDIDTVWPAVDWPASLHRFATSLVPLAADDPAALAFCGRRPLDSVPHHPAPLTPAQSAALAQARYCLHDALSMRLAQWSGPGLIERVARRRGRIAADPGWFEVRYSLRDVSIDIRRAALDLDPGFIRWLGIVLRYVYE